MYKLHTNMIGETIVEKIGCNVFFRVPTQPDSNDAAEYLAWLEAGNTPLPADEPTA